MKINRSRPTGGAFRPDRASDAAPVSVTPPASAGRTVTDVATVLGITEGDLTPNVRAGLAKLIAEVDRLRRDLDEKERRIVHLERLADEDPLTPVLNRRAFVRELSRMMSFADRYRTPSSVVYIDVNDMKALNDTHGHAAGDAALSHVANLLLANIRASDAVGRLGGDEFGVLLAQADQTAAVAKAAGLKREIEAAPVHWDGQTLAVSVSVGACAFTGGSEPHEILRAADQAMYRQKRGVKIP